MKRKVLALIGVAYLSFSVAPGPAQPQRPSDDPLLRWMNEIAQQQLDQRERAVAEIHSTADAERRKRTVREKILRLMGGLPDYTGPLNPRITGRIENERFTIEMASALMRTDPLVLG